MLRRVAAKRLSNIGAWLGLSTLLLAAMPLAAGDGRSLGSGEASYYASSFAGRRTASGEIYSPAAMTAAHRTAPFDSFIRVRNLGNGREVTVRVNDRGPHAKGRVIDLSLAAAKVIGLQRSGTARVSLTLVK